MAELEDQIIQDNIPQPVVEDTPIVEQEVTEDVDKDLQVVQTLEEPKEQVSTISTKEPETEPVIKPKKVKIKDTEKGIQSFVSQMNNNYSNLDFKVDDDDVLVTNVSTGEKYEYSFPKDTQGEDIPFNQLKIDRLNNFIELNSQSDSEAKYIYEETGITPRKTKNGETIYQYGGFLGIGTESVNKPKMYAAINKTKKIARDLYVRNNPEFSIYDAKELAGMQIDFNAYTEQQLTNIKDKIYERVNDELIEETRVGIPKDIFYKIYDSNIFQQNLNSSINEIANEKIYDLAVKKYGTDEARPEFIAYKEKWLENQLDPSARERLSTINKIKELNKSLEEAEARGTEGKRDVARIKQEIANEQTKIYTSTSTIGGVAPGTSLQITKSINKDAFTPDGFWKMPENEQDADRYKKSINSGFGDAAFIASLLSKAGIEGPMLEEKTDVDRMKDIYDQQLFLSQNIFDIGREKSLEFKMDIETATEAAARGLEGGDVQMVLQKYKEENPEAYDEKTGKLKIPYNDFYKSSISVKDLEGFFDEAMGYIPAKDLLPYKAWKEEKIETEGVLQGIHSLLYLNLDPAAVQKEAAPVVFARNLIKAFATGDFYGEMDEEKASQATNYFMGRDPRETLNNMKTAISDFNSKHPENQLKLSPEQEENIKETISELTASGLGQFVPFLFEMAVIGTVTEGTGLSPYLAKLPGYLRVPAIMGLEEFKMAMAPSAPYHMGTGAVFGGLGQLSNAIPYKIFSKYFRALRPFYEKVGKAGWVGAASTQVNEVVVAFSEDLMGDADFMTQFNNLYGGVLEGKDEDTREFLKRLLVDSFVFGISGAAHLGKTDFKSTAGKVQLVQDLTTEIIKTQENLNNIMPKGVDGKPVKIEDISDLDFSPELKQKVKAELEKIEALESTIVNVQRSVSFETIVSDLNPNNANFQANYKKRIIDKVEARLSKRVDEYNALNPNNKIEKPKIEFITGRGESFRNNNDFNNTQAAKFEQTSPGSYRLLLDLNKYSPGKPIHEIGHLFEAEHFRLNPNAKVNMSKNPLSKTLENTVLYTDSQGNKITGGTIKEIVEVLYKDKGVEVQEQEFMGNMLELLTDPNFYFSNPEISGTMLGGLKREFKNILKKYEINLFEGTSEIRTVEDLVKSIYTLGNEVGSGFISERSLDILENLSAGRYNELGDIAISDVVASEQYIRTKLTEAKENLKEEFASEDIFEMYKLSEQAKIKNQTLREQILENENSGIPNERQKDEIVTNNIPLVNSIAFTNQLYTNAGLENIPNSAKKLVAEDLFYDLVKVVNTYDGNKSGIETWIRNSLSKRVVESLRKTGYFDRQSEVGGEDADLLMENFSKDPFKGMGETLYEINNSNPKAPKQEVPTRFDTYYKVIDKKGKINETNKSESVVEFDYIKDNISTDDVGVDIVSYATTPAKASPKFYERIGVPENKIKDDIGGYKKGATRLSEGQLDNAQNWLKNNIDQIFEILPDGYVPIREYEVTPGEPAVSSDKLGGTSTGVQNVLLELGIYNKTGAREKDKRGAGLEGYKKVDELTPELKKEIEEFFGIKEDGNNVDMKDNTNLDSRFRAIIFQTDRALTNQVVDNIAVNQIKDMGVVNDLRLGKTRTLASENIIEVMIGELGFKTNDAKWRGPKAREELLTMLEDIEATGNIPNTLEGEALRAAVVNQVRYEKDGAGFIKQAKELGLPTFKSFSSKKKGEERVFDTDAQDRQVDQAISIIKEFLPSVATDARSTKTGKLGSFLPALYKLGSNRLVGNVGSERGVKLTNVIKNNKKTLEQIKDPEVREAWEKFFKLADKFEPANSDKMSNFNIGTILQIAEGKKLVQFEGKDGKVYIFDPLGKATSQEGVVVIKGTSKEAKIEAIDKAFDKDVIESLRAYDYAFNITLQKWYNAESAKGTKQKKAAQEFLFRHFQLTTNQVMSDRAFAPFTSILLKDGPQTFYKTKGEHIQDAATNTVKKYEAIINNKYNANFHELLSSDYFQSLTEKEQLDFVDKALGTNTNMGELKMLAGKEGVVPAMDIYDFSKGKFMYDILLEQTFKQAKETLQKENVETVEKDLAPENKVQSDIIKDIVESGEGSLIYEIQNNLRERAQSGNEEVVQADIFDLDDNLVFTRTKVKYELPNGEKGELDAQEFNMYKEALESDGAKFDYSEFNKVIKEKLGPAFNEFKKAYARSPEDTFIMTARAPGSKKAIQAWLASEGYKLPIENIITTEGTEFTEGGLKGENKKGYTVLGFYTGRYNGKRYNTINFSDDYNPNVEAVKFVTDQFDNRGKVYQTFASEDIAGKAKEILGESTGFDKNDLISYSVAVNQGAQADKKKKLIPYSAEDFTGLIYATLGKGKKGEAQLEFYKKNLLDPYNKGIQALEIDKVNMMNDFKALKKNLKTPKGLNEKAVLGFSKQDAIRVYLWNKQGEKIPGLQSSDIAKMNNYVVDNPELLGFANEILKVTKGDNYSKPGEAWMAGTITTDLLDLINGTKRQKYLSQFLDNSSKIFTEENKNKLRAKYGNKYIEALENSLTRMEKGSNRIFSGSRIGNRALDYLNNSTGAIMFLNTRSAVLQTISAANYVNWSFNNPLKASAAFANQGQYWKDFMTLMNSDYLVSRRNGLKMNINENEIAEAAKRDNSSIKGAMSYAIEKGYAMTKYADSFAIASGGATFYRNRINDLVKREGLSEVEAQKQALQEWRDISEVSQQSSDPSKISQQQSSDIGRLLLSFANTPMQYVRMQKRAAQDLLNRRGDDKSNISKLIYYGFVQNLMFNAMQQALFAGDEETIDKKTINTFNGMLDTQLRGMGIAGNTTAMIKNVVLDLYKRSGRSRPEYIDALWKITSVSPAIGSKISKLKGAAYQFDSKKRREQMIEKGFSFDNPIVEAGTKTIEATTNLPLDRLRRKVENISDAMKEETEWWQSVAMLLGWPEWQLVDKGTKDKSRTGGYVGTQSTITGPKKKQKGGVISSRGGGVTLIGE